MRDRYAPAAYKVDPNRIFLIGQSAGGRWRACWRRWEGPWKKAGGWTEQSHEIRAVISVCAPYELNTLDWGKLWVPIGVDAEAARKEASPIVHVKATSKPILILHSDDDKSVPIQQAVEMAEALKKAGARHKFLHYTDKGHMQIVDYVIHESVAFIKDSRLSGRGLIVASFTAAYLSGVQPCGSSDEATDEPEGETKSKVVSFDSPAARSDQPSAGVRNV